MTPKTHKKPVRLRSATAWCLKDPDGILDTTCVLTTRNGVVREVTYPLLSYRNHEVTPRQREEWKKLYTRGFRIVRVWIEEEVTR